MELLQPVQPPQPVKPMEPLQPTEPERRLVSRFHAGEIPCNRRKAAPGPAFSGIGCMVALVSQSCGNTRADVRRTRGEIGACEKPDRRGRVHGASPRQSKCNGFTARLCQRRVLVLKARHKAPGQPPTKIGPAAHLAASSQFLGQLHDLLQLPEQLDGRLQLTEKVDMSRSKRPTRPWWPEGNNEGALSLGRTTQGMKYEEKSVSTAKSV